MQSWPRFTGLNSSPATACTLPSLTPTMTPQPTPQKRHGAFVQVSRGSRQGPAAGLGRQRPQLPAHLHVLGAAPDGAEELVVAAVLGNSEVEDSVLAGLDFGDTEVERGEGEAVADRVHIAHAQADALAG